MRRYLLLPIVLLVMLATSVVGEVKWYKGVPHNHCKDFSDGTSTSNEVKTLVANHGCDFLIESDHFEQTIVKSTISKYLATFDCLGPQVKGKNEQLLCVAGAEFMATTKHGPHILLLHLEKEMPGYRDNMGQEELVQWLKQNSSAPLIIAHPFWTTYQYNFSLPTSYSPDGVEIFNYGNYAKTRDAYLKGKGKIATSGWDYHTPVDPTNNSRFKHITYVWINGKLTAESLLSAISNGQTYASNDGAVLTKINYLPSFTYQEVSRPEFNFEVSFPESTLDQRLIRIYRDGEPVSESKKNYPIGATKMAYSWTDSQASIGNHGYCIEVEGYLVTSPICLSVTDMAETGANKPKKKSLGDKLKDLLAKVKGIKIPDIFNPAPGVAKAEDTIRLPVHNNGKPQILLGKTRAEIEALFGEPFPVTDSGRNNYLYPDTPPGCEMSIHFQPYPYGSYDYEVSGKNVQSVILTSCWIDDISKNHIRSFQIVPAEVLDRKPSHVYRAMFHNSIIVVWHIGQSTYVLTLCDVPSRQLYRTVRGKMRTKYFINQNTFKLRSDTVISFTYIKHIFNPPLGSMDVWGQPYDYYDYTINHSDQGISQIGCPFDK